MASTHWRDNTGEAGGLGGGRSSFARGVPAAAVSQASAIEVLPTAPD